MSLLSLSPPGVPVVELGAVPHPSADQRAPGPAVVRRGGAAPHPHGRRPVPAGGARPCVLDPSQLTAQHSLTCVMA